MSGFCSDSHIYYAYNSSKVLPIMLNIMPMTTAIMPQFVYDFIIFNDCRLA